MQVFHVGYPKSGSTTIQGILHADRHINYLGKPYRTQAAEYHVREHLPFSDLRQLPADIRADMRAALCTGQPIISDEILSGVGFSHGMAANSLLQIVDNIQLLTDGDFVAYVVFRRPANFIRSYYGQLVRAGARMSFDQFCSLVLLRRHHWLYQSVNYRTILDSDHYRTGRLRPVLFEQLFNDGGITEFVQQAFGASGTGADSAHLNTSDSDSALDIAAHESPRNPAAWVDKLVQLPTIHEYKWMDRRPADERDAHRALWTTQREEAFRLAQESTQFLGAARAALGRHRGKRPPSPMFERLLAAISETNRGAVEAFPEVPFAQYKYFD